MVSNLLITCGESLRYLITNRGQRDVLHEFNNVRFVDKSVVMIVTRPF